MWQLERPRFYYSSVQKQNIDAVAGTRRAVTRTFPETTARALSLSISKDRVRLAAAHVILLLARVPRPRIKKTRRRRPQRRVPLKRASVSLSLSLSLSFAKNEPSSSLSAGHPQLAALLAATSPRCRVVSLRPLEAALINVERAARGETEPLLAPRTGPRLRVATSWAPEHPFYVYERTRRELAPNDALALALRHPPRGDALTTTIDSGAVTSRSDRRRARFAVGARVAVAPPASRSDARLRRPRAARVLAANADGSFAVLYDCDGDVDDDVLPARLTERSSVTNKANNTLSHNSSRQARPDASHPRPRDPHQRAPRDHPPYRPADPPPRLASAQWVSIWD